MQPSSRTGVSKWIDQSANWVIGNVLLTERILTMNRICALLLLPVAWHTLSIVKADDKSSDVKPAVIIETIQIDNVDVVSIHTKSTRILARSLTLDGGSTIKPSSGQIEINSGESRTRTKKLELYVRLKIEQIDLVRIELEPAQK